MKRVHAIRADDVVFKSLKHMAVDDGVSMGVLFEKLVFAELERRSREDGSVIFDLRSVQETSEPDAPRLNRRERRALKNKRK